MPSNPSKTSTPILGVRHNPAPMLTGVASLGCKIEPARTKGSLVSHAGSVPWLSGPVLGTFINLGAAYKARP